MNITIGGKQVTGLKPLFFTQIHPTHLLALIYACRMIKKKEKKDENTALEVFGWRHQAVPKKYVKKMKN